MERNSSPLRWVMLGLFTLLMGGFLAAVHIGNLSRQEEMMRGGFGYRGQRADAAGGAPAAQGSGTAASPASAGRGGSFSEKVSGLADSLLDWLGGKSAPDGSASVAQRPPEDRGGAASEERDPFEEFYGKYYGHSSAASSPPGGGFSSFAGGSSSSSGASAPSAGPSAASAQPAPAGPAASAAAARQEQPGKPLFGGPLGRSGNRPPPLQASLPSGGLPRQPASAGPDGGFPGLPAGQRAARGSGGGSVSGMRGGVAAADLNDAASSLRNGAQGEYASKMSMGAAAVASGAGGSGGGGGSAPAASSAGSSGGSSGGGSADAPKPASSSGDEKGSGEQKSSAAEEDYGGLGANSAGPGPEQAFMKSVAVERRNGEEVKYLAEADYKAMPERTLLKSGGMPAEYDDKDQKTAEQPAADGSGDMKSLSFEKKRAPRPPDPENFSSLTDERKIQLRERMHRFIRRFENKYGEMTDIFFTPCMNDAALCEKHGLKEGYLTEATSSDAQLVLGLKYSRKRWRPYTVSVTLPGTMLAQEDDGGGPQGR